MTVEVEGGGKKDAAFFRLIEGKKRGKGRGSSGGLSNKLILQRRSDGGKRGWEVLFSFFTSERKKKEVPFEYEGLMFGLMDKSAKEGGEGGCAFHSDCFINRERKKKRSYSNVKSKG